MADVTTPSPDDFAEIRAAMAAGQLEEFLQTATAGHHAALYAIVHDVITKLVQQRERSRGHARCAASPDRMDPECHDRLQNTVATMRAALLKHGRVRISNAEGWLVSRFTATTVDEERRRRSTVGALQRPRMPKWLGRQLDGAWLHRLALEIMKWVGVPNSAGLHLWPVSAWADLRDRITGGHGSSEATVLADVEIVLDAMRTNMPWYERYIERPTGAKQTGVVPAQRGGEDGGAREPDHLVLVSRDEVRDALLRDLATAAVDAIARRVAGGQDVAEAARSVLVTVFTGHTAADELGDAPGADLDPTEHLEVLLTDPATVQRIVKAVTEIIRERDAAR